MNTENVTYFDSFGVEHIAKKKKKKLIGNENIITNIYRIQLYDLVMCRYFCIRFMDFSLKGNINLFSPNECDSNDKIIIKYFQ